MSSGYIREDQLLRERRRQLASSLLKNTEELIKKTKVRTYIRELEEIKRELENLKERAKKFTYASEEEAQTVRRETEEINRKIKQIQQLERIAGELAEKIGKVKIKLSPLVEKKAKIEWRIEIPRVEEKEGELRAWLLNAELAKIRPFLTADEMEELKSMKDLSELQRKIIEYSTEMEVLKDKAEFLIKEYGQSKVLEKTMGKIKEALEEGNFLRLKELVKSAEEILKDEAVQKTMQLEKEIKEKMPGYEIAFEKEKLIIYGDDTMAEMIVGQEIEVEAFQPTGSFCERMREFSQEIGAKWEEREGIREMEREMGR